MGTTNYNFTYLEPNNQIDLVGDTTTFLNEIDATIKDVADNQIIRVAVIGDSYGSYYVNRLRELVSGKATIDNYSVGSTGFVRETAYGNGINFANHAQRIAESGKVYDKVIIYGGINDCSSRGPDQPYSQGNQWGYISGGQLENGVNSVNSILKNYAGTSKAEIVCVFNETSPLSSHAVSDSAVPYTFFYSSMNKAAIKCGWNVVMNGRWWLWLGNHYSDGTHPDAAGSEIIAKYMAGLINGIRPHIEWYSYLWVQHSTTPVISQLTAANYRVNYHFNEGKIILHISPTNYTGFEPGNLTVQKSNITALGSDFIIPSYHGVEGYLPIVPYTAMGSWSVSNMAFDSTNLMNMSFKTGSEVYSQYGTAIIGFEVQI